MSLLYPSNHNRLTTMLRLHSPLLDPKDEIPERNELTNLDHVSPKNRNEVKVYQLADRLDPRYRAGKYTLSYRMKLNKSSHNIHTMT
jgi:hypothetical protein